MSIEENCSFVVDNVLEGDAEGRVQIVEELLVENERNSWNKKMSLKKTAQTSSFFYDLEILWINLFYQLTNPQQ